MQTHDIGRGRAARRQARHSHRVRRLHGGLCPSDCRRRQLVSIVHREVEQDPVVEGDDGKCMKLDRILPDGGTPAPCSADGVAQRTGVTLQAECRAAGLPRPE
jgi:hypothetical protein